MDQEMNQLENTEEKELKGAKAETMSDYEAELEASFKKVREGDILTGTVISVDDDQVILDLKYYAEGIISKDDLSNDPEFHLKEEIHPGDEITATVIKTDDGEGNIVLSRKQANDLLAWDKLKQMMEDRTVVKIKIAEIVKSGAVAYLEGIRAFIPASKLAAEYVENLEEWNGRTLEATVITADEENKRLVLSGREVAREKLAEETRKRVAKCQPGAIVEGTVETLKDYGAFVTLENGLTGLLHISQISSQRIKHPGAVLKEGQAIKVKILSADNGKISLSMKAIQPEDEPEEVFDYKESGAATTGLGALLKGIKLQ
jgi:small subunit ribosomal protein S1